MSWQAPPALLAPITAYVVTPRKGQLSLPPIRFNSPATTETVTGLTNGATYTFTVAAINALGNLSAASESSNAVTPAPSSFAHVDGGAVHTCGIVAADGTVKCWGWNFYGQLGNGTNTDSSAPVPVSGLSAVTAITAGASHSCALMGDSTVDCWGSNASGQLGNGTNTDSSAPVAVSGLSGVTAITVGASHTCALMGDSTVECWGSDASGQLGDGTNTDSPTPVAVSGLTGATAIAAGSGHTCALMGDSTVECWGSDASGQLGNGTTTSSLTPVAVSGLRGATAIAAGSGHTCALMGDSSVECWGSNASGQFGNGTTTDSLTPVAVSGLRGATALTAGDIHSCAIYVGGFGSGSVTCWGSDSNGQLGNDSIGVDSSTPVAVQGLTGVTAISGGHLHTCAVAGAGALDCWGWNGYGQVGNGTTTDSGTPTPVL